MDREAFFGKAEWEGGLVGLAEYGLAADDIADPSLRKLWGEYLEQYKKLAEIEAEIMEFSDEDAD